MIFNIWTRGPVGIGIGGKIYLKYIYSHQSQLDLWSKFWKLCHPPFKFECNLCYSLQKFKKNQKKIEDKFFFYEFLIWLKYIFKKICV